MHSHETFCFTLFCFVATEQQALNNSDTSSSTLHIPAILVPSSNMHSKAQSVASSGFGSLTALNSESELEGPGGRTSKVQAGSLSKRRVSLVNVVYLAVGSSAVYRVCSSSH